MLNYTRTPSLFIPQPSYANRFKNRLEVFSVFNIVYSTLTIYKAFSTDNRTSLPLKLYVQYFDYSQLALFS